MLERLSTRKGLLLFGALATALVAAFWILGGVAWAAPTFTATTTASTAAAESPRSVTTADFDRDGDVDLGVANQLDDDFSIWKNNGTGTFAAPAAADILTVGDNPRGIATADFNGDSRPDVATANYGTGTAAGTGNISVRLNTNTTPGTTSFGAATTYDNPVATNPISIVAADFDGINGPDLAVLNEGSDNVSIFLNNPDTSGSLTLQASSPTVGDSPESIVTADFDGDGDRDLAVANLNSDTVSVLLNNGSGVFTLGSSPAVGDGPNSVTTGDFNNDGIIDLATANRLGDTVSALLGNGNGTFGSAITSAPLEGTSAPFAVTAADYDGNGNTDLAVTNLLTPGTVFFLQGNGNGTFGVTAATGSASYNLGPSAGDNPTSITTADLNVDGRPDLATTNSGATFTGSGTRDGISVLLNTTTRADLSIVKTDSPDPVLAGQELTYTLTVTNNGPSAASNVVVTDTIPANTTFVSSTPSAGGSCSGTSTVSCTFPTLATGATATVTIKVRPQAAAVGTLSNTGRVNSATADFNRANNSSTTATQVNAAADVSLTKTDSPDPATVGENLTYTLTATNGGPNQANNTVIQDTLPANTTFVSASSGCSASGGVVTCNLGDLANGASVERQIVVRPTAAGLATNTAQVSSSTADPTSTNNSASATTQVNAANLSITKTDNPDPVTFGNDITYTVNVANSNTAGTANATNVQVTDPLPANTTFVSASTTQGSCQTPPNPGDTSGTLTCNLGTIGAGASATVTIKVRPNQQAVTAGSVTNTARVTSPNDPGTSPTPKQDAETTTVNAADLTVVKNGPATVGTGRPFSYELTVSNTGTGTATNVEVEDTLPGRVTLDGPLPDGCSSTGTGGVGDPVEVTCILPDIPGGGSQSVSINVRAPNTPRTLNNTATATSPNDPETPPSNRATTEVLPATLRITKEDAPDPVDVGQDLEYTVTVTNDGTGDASDVTVTDQLPANAAFVSATTSQGTCPTEPAPGDSGGTVGCDLGTVEAGDTETVTIVVRPTLAAAGTELDNEATVSSPSDPDTSPTPKRATATTTVRPEADLSIRKDGPPQATNGQAFDYTLTVTNDGPNAATNVVATDDLPDGVTYNDGDSTPSCRLITGTPDPNDVRCTLANLAANDSTTFIINVTPTQAEPLANQATVSSDTNDPEDANNTSNTVNTTVNPAADLSISKVDSPDPVTFGDELTYTLTATNGGPNTATNVVITDQLPEEVEFVSAPDCDYDDPSRTVTCNVGDLANGASAQRQIVGRPTATGAVNNTATVTSPTADLDEDNNSATATTTVSAADLTITKTDSEDPVFAGEDFDYILRVSNEGARDARDVIVTDRLPDGLEFVEAQDCSYNPGNRVVTCQFGTVIAGSPAVERRITVTAPADPTTLNNTATVRSPNDPTTARDSEQTTVDASADLSISKTAPPSVTDEDTFTYTLTVNNAGPSTAEDVSITDELPVGIQFVSADGGCDYDPDTRTVTCSVAAVESGASVERQIVVKARTPGDKVNTAVVSSETRDPDDQNNSSTATTTVNASADLAIDKQAPEEVTDEQEFDYALTVTNDGPSDAGNIVVSDTLPGGVQFVEAGTDPRCQYNPVDRTVSCELGSLGTAAPRDSTEVVIRVKAKQPGTQLNSARVSSATPDPDESNNVSREVTTVIQALADLDIDKSGSPSAVNVGEVVTYTLSVTNNGPSDSTDIVVTDDLPANVEFVETGTDPRCQFEANDPDDPGDDTVTCTRTAPLAAPPDDNTDTFTIRIRPTLAAADSTLTNEARVESETPDSNPDNNSDTAQTTVNPAADLSITKGDAPDPVTFGNELTYTLTVTNDGPNPAGDVAVTDNLPENATFVSATPSRGTCPTQPAPGDSGGTVGCDLGSIPADDSATVTIVVKPTAASVGGQITNTASVSSPTFDPDTDDLSSGATTDVNAANLAITKDDGTGGTGRVTAGQIFTYTIEVTNEGPADARDVVVTDTLPAAVTYVDAPQCTYNAGTRVVTCRLGNIAADGPPVVREIEVRAPAEETTFTNTAIVRSPNDPSNGRDGVRTTTADASSNLSIQKVSDPATVTDEDTFSYRLTVRNAGPSTAQGVTVTDDLPAGVEFVSVSSSLDTPGQEACEEPAQPDGSVTCDFGAVASGGSPITVNIRVKAKTPTPPGEPLSNTATVSSQTSDPDPDNDSSTATTTVNAAADLSIDKAADPEPVTVGGVLTYTLSVTNNGPSAATGVNVTDDLPAGVTYDDASSSSECSLVIPAENVVECGPVGLTASGAGATKTFTIKVTVEAAALPSITNNASVAGNEPDPDEGNNEASEDTLVNAAGLTIEKGDSPDPVTFGDELAYEISVTNNSEARATNVRVIDQLPDNVTFVSATGGCTYDAGDRTVACGPFDLASGAEATRQIVVTPTAAAVGTTLTNQATVTSPNDPTDSTATATTRVVAADLRITKTDSEDPVFAGENFDYIVRVVNQGAGARDVVVTDKLPAGLRFFEAPGCDFDGGTRVLTCSLGVLANGETAERRITVRAASDPATFRNTATVRSPNDPSNGRDVEQTTTVVASADLSISKTAPRNVTDEENFTYTLTARNGGPSTSRAVRIVDKLPAGVGFVSARGCTETGGTVSCEVGDLDRGATAVRRIIVRAKTPGETTNTATVDGATADLDPSNNSDSATTRIDAAADLALEKRAPAEIYDEQELTFTLEVTNNGPSASENARVVDQLPAGVAYRSSTDASADGCRLATGGEVRCELGSVAPRARATATITVRVKEPGELLNTATVSSSVADPDPDNNTDTTTTTASPLPTIPADCSTTVDNKNVIVGGPGDERIDGTPEADLIFGLEGNDVINGSGGTDVLIGGAGDDRLITESGNDRLCGEAGIDRFSSGAGNDLVSGGTEEDYIHTFEGNDQIKAGDGDDNIRSYSGNDRVYGEAGNDGISAVDGVEGNDVADGGPGESDYCSADPRDKKVSCELP